jgi:uncharacterized membrane protein
MMDQGRLNRTLYLVLRSGMLLSLGTMLLGLMMYILSPGIDEGFIPLERLWNELVHADPIAVMELGIMFLIATPLIRIISALIVFAYEKDVKFVIISSLVLSVIILAVVVQI